MKELREYNNININMEVNKFNEELAITLEALEAEIKTINHNLIKSILEIINYTI